jgi:hypothetical protein
MFTLVDSVTSHSFVNAAFWQKLKSNECRIHLPKWRWPMALLYFVQLMSLY